MMFEFAQWLELTPVSITIKSIKWIVPLVQSIHIITIGIVFVSLLTIAMRVLGWTRMDQAFGVVMARFAPWIRHGLVVLLLTGALVVGEPIREMMSLSFWLKMGLHRHRRRRAPWRSAGLLRWRAPAPSRSSPPTTKSAAMVTVLLWLAIIFLGRAIAYDVECGGRCRLSPRGAERGDDRRGRSHQVCGVSARTAISEWMRAR